MGQRETLVERLRQRGLVWDAGVASALQAVDRGALVPEPLRPAAAVDVPVPLDPETGRGLLPSPGLTGVALHLLEAVPGLRTLTAGDAGGVAALLPALVPDLEVAVLVGSDAEAVLVSTALERAGASAVTVTTEPAGTWDRILLLDDGWTTADLRPHVADLGFLLAAQGEGASSRFVKHVRRGADVVELAVTAVDLSEATDARSASLDVARTLVLEEAMANVWRDRETAPHDRHFREVVEETFLPEEAARERYGEAYPVWRWARTLFHLAYIHQTVGQLDEAIVTYEASLAVLPTAEAHTFLGWSHSFLGAYDAAMAACERAIEVDPSFGNPYNDIGAYLVEQGDLDGAVPWFERALEADRYCCYFYAWSNLGRVYLAKGMRAKARRAFREALRMNPDYEYARQMLEAIDRDVDYIA